MKTHFKIGDEVTIKNHGEIYTTYSKLFEQLGFKNQKENSTYFENKKDLTYTVFNKCKHPNNKLLTMYGIVDGNGNEILINQKGIKHKKYTVSKDFILEAHESACSTCKTKIENQFPELFPKVELEFGKWYKRGSELLVWNGGENTYGFTEDGYYYDDMLFSCFTTAIPATKEEVETALIAEAKRRGLVDGAKIEQVKYGGVRNLKSGGADYTYFPEEDYMTYFGWTIYSKGEWSKVIKETLEVSLDEIAEKFGVDVSQIKIKK